MNQLGIAMTNALRRGAVIFAALLTFCSVTIAENWAVFRPSGVGYSLEMPGEWTVTEREIPSVAGPLTGHVAWVSRGEHAYMTMYVEYPAWAVKKTTATAMLDGARDGAVENAHGTLRSEQRLLVSNLPTRNIIIDTEKAVVVDRFFLLKNSLIQALVIGPHGLETEANTKRFLDSLQVVPND
jgi:hypothetical protein